MGTFRIWLADQNPIHWPSGETNGTRASAVPAIGCASGRSSDRRNSCVRPAPRRLDDERPAVRRERERRARRQRRERVVFAEHVAGRDVERRVHRRPALAVRPSQESDRARARSATPHAVAASSPHAPRHQAFGAATSASGRCAAARPPHRRRPWTARRAPRRCRADASGDRVRGSARAAGAARGGVAAGSASSAGVCRSTARASR